MYKNVLITGGAGNLGRYVAEGLKDKYNVTLFDKTTPDKAPFPWETDLLFITGELTDLGDCMRAITLSKADVIIHLAGIPHPTDLQSDTKRRPQRLPEDTTMKVNTMGTYYVLDAARRLGVKKVIFASTFYTLGLGNRLSGTPFKVDYLPIDEEHPLRPEDTYGLSKVFGEELLEAYSRAYGMKTVAFRLMGVEYPHRPTHKVNVTPEPRPGFKGGFTIHTWQYVDARDIAYACDLAIQKDLENGFEAFYLSTDNTFPGESRKVVEEQCPDLKEMAANLKGTEGIISIQKIKDLLGYEPQHSWRNSK